MRVDNAFLDKKRLEGDFEADKLVKSLFERGDEKQLYQSFRLPDSDLSSLGPELQAFYSGIRQGSKNFDLDRVKAGQLFYRSYAMEIMMLLGAMSLPYCYAAVPGNKPLYLTEKIRKRTGKRLFDTAEYVISIMEPGCLDENGHGYALTNKTRLIHALVRHKLKAEKIWEGEWGEPINQEDMAGTNLAFSFIILEGLKRQRFPMDEEEMNNFLYTWRYIGFLLHIDEALLPETYRQAEELKEVIKKRNFRESPEGKLLMKDLLAHYRISFPHIASWLVDSQIRYFLGSDISAMLGMKYHPLKDPLTLIINRAAQAYNRINNHKSSYDVMIRDHEKSRGRFG
jgi:hypothetical protein